MKIRKEFVEVEASVDELREGGFVMGAGAFGVQAVAALPAVDAPPSNEFEGATQGDVVRDIETEEIEEEIAKEEELERVAPPAPEFDMDPPPPPAKKKTPAGKKKKPTPGRKAGVAGFAACAKCGKVAHWTALPKSEKDGKRYCPKHLP